MVKIAVVASIFLLLHTGTEHTTKKPGQDNARLSASIQRGDHPALVLTLENLGHESLSFETGIMSSAPDSQDFRLAYFHFSFLTNDKKYVQLNCASCFPPNNGVIGMLFNPYIVTLSPGKQRSLSLRLDRLYPKEYWNQNICTAFPKGGQLTAWFQEKRALNETSDSPGRLSTTLIVSC